MCSTTRKPSFVYVYPHAPPLAKRLSVACITSYSKPVLVSRTPRFLQPRRVSARSCVVLDASSGRVLFAKNPNERREIASLTKIMTCYTVLRLAHCWNLRLQDLRVEVSSLAARTEGTTAGLAAGDVLNVYDLLFAMMLPSGNDAAVALAEFFGALLHTHRSQPEQTHSENWRGYPQKLFVHEMNELARAMGLSQTRYNNPHGLANVFNRSTAADVAKLSARCMRSRSFRDIVATKEYTCYGCRARGVHEFVWRNTNRMLLRGYSGVKTGVTSSAGPCLCSSVEREGRHIIVVLLYSKTMEDRWGEAEQLVDWAIVSGRKTAADISNKSGAKRTEGRNCMCSIYRSN